MADSSLWKTILRFPMKNRWILYRCTQGAYKAFGIRGGTLCCHFCREREYSKASLFSSTVFPGRTADFLRMAGKTFKPCRGVTGSNISRCSCTALSGGILKSAIRAENILVFLQLHGAEPQRDRDAGQHSQYPSYCAMKLLPYQEENFSTHTAVKAYRTSRFFISQKFRNRYFTSVSSKTSKQE